jgi:hypothetical protein
MVLLTNQHFMDELTKLFQANKTKGSVWITMKRRTILPNILFILFHFAMLLYESPS